MNHLRLALAVVALIACRPLVAAPPTAEQMQQLRQDFYQKYGELRDESGAVDEAKLAAWLDERLGEMDPAEMDLATLEQLAQLYMAADVQRQRFTEALEQRVAQPDVEGVAAGMLLVQTSMTGPDSKPDLSKVMDHPALKEAIVSGRMAGSAGMLAWVPAESVRPYAGRLSHIVREMDSVDSMPAVSTMSGLAEAITRKDAGLSVAQRDALLDHVTAVLQRAADATEDERMKTSCERRVTFFNGAAARGRLIDHEAPELEFLWTSDETLGGKLSDLRGKVVVLDFWATWCGPCIGSFPNVRELVEHYQGYDVVVVGVTSVQGSHYGADGPVDCEDDPQKEFGLMKDFMAEKEMTWPVAFASTEVFNPDYGVRGIPHVAILDVHGKVRFNGLHPANPLAEKTEKIDKLLHEVGRPAPVAVGGGEPSDG
ncbi:MAG: TlpA family protein disulfide reductase [Planctomycetota bacterium]|jgi:thiol-disulfide isomerase/thioredoxin